jgi:ATP-dependent protease HslVU (ClpYQ) peptidase subunit
MTTIIGLQYDDHAFLAADSQVTDGDRPFRHKLVSKIVQRGPYVISCAGEDQPIDILQHIWKPLPIPASAKKDLFHFVVAEVMPSMRKCLTENGYVFPLTYEDADERGFDALLVVNGTIFQFSNWMAVIMRDDGIYGIGSGSAYAIGAIENGATWQKAMQSAAKNDIYTSAPFVSHKQLK